MEDLLESLGITAKGSQKSPLPTHCNTALTQSAARAAIGRPAVGQYISRKNVSREEWLKISEMFPIPRIDCFDSSLHQGALLNTQPFPTVHDWTIQQKVQESTALTLFNASLEALGNVGKLGLKKLTSQDLDSRRPQLSKLYQIRCFWEEIVLLTGADRSFNGHLWKSTPSNGIYMYEAPNFRAYASSTLFLIFTDRGISLLSRDHLTCIADLAAQRYVLFEAIALDSMLGTGTLTWEQASKLLEVGDNLIQSGGNEAYGLIYGLEASCVSRLVGDTPLGSENGPTFYNQVRKEQGSLAKRLKVVDLWLQREELLDILKENPNALAQAYGLFRLWGHPTVDPLAGASALQTIATNVRLLNAEAAITISNKFKEEFTKRYYEKHKCWPKMNMEGLSKTCILVEAYKNVAAVPVRHPRYSRKLWTNVEFEQCFTVDPKFEILEVISDKALSLDTDELIKCLNEQIGSGSATQRAVLVQWLKSTLDDPKKFLDYIDKCGFPDRERSIGLKEKEREGKIAARLFGLTTLFKRMYIVLTEALLAEHILPYFPEITMTDDELSLDKKRLEFTKRIQNRFRLFTSLDFSKWNTNMREAETYLVFLSFDKLFGFTAVFIRTHEMFKTSDMYLLNGSYTPQLDPDAPERRLKEMIGTWRGHLGGIEGLRQKGWTVWTIILIMLCAEDSQLELHLMGQGDNQILLQVFPPRMKKEECMKVHYRFIARLDEMLKVIGPPLKLEETWTSEDLFIYGKYIIYKDSPLETSYKRLCRMFRMSNEDFPTLESAISSLTANVSAGLSCSHSISSEYYLYVSELVGLFQVFLLRPYLQLNPPIDTLDGPGSFWVPGAGTVTTQAVLDSKSLSSVKFFCRLCLLPRCLGGFPIINMGQLLIRGFPDDVSLAVSFLRLLYPHVTSSLKRYIQRILSPPLLNRVNLQLILDNPTALNLITPPAPGEARRSLVVEFLKHSMPIANPSFKEFVNLMDPKQDAELIEYLGQCKPFNPVLLGSIMDATLQARARKVVGKLQKTRTISKLAVEEGEYDLYTKIREAELAHLRCVLNRVQNPEMGPIQWHPSKCTVHHVKELRDKGWQRVVEGVDCAPPYEVLRLEDNAPDKPCLESLELNKGFISMRLPYNSTSGFLSDPMSRGPFRPYRGSATQQKVISFGSKVASYSKPLLSKAARLGALIGWGVPRNGHLHILINNLLQSITDLSLDKLIPFDDQISGSIHHRLESDRVEKGGAVCVLPNYGTKMSFNTFPLTAYSKGSKNVNLMFQSLMSVAVVIQGTRFRVSSEVWYPTVHLHIKSSCCIREINPDLVEGIPKLIHFPKYPDNPFLFVKEVDALPAGPRKTTFSSTTRLSNDPLENQVRLVSLVAFKILESLSLPNWDTPWVVHNKPGLVINWCLRLPLQQTLETVALLIASFFSSSISHKTPSQFLDLVAEKVYRSHIHHWTFLSNLVHTPNLHHELVKGPYYTHISGNPELNDHLLAVNVKNCVATILRAWADNPSDRERIGLLDIRAPLTCGVIHHPSLLLFLKKWLLDVAALGPITERNAIIAAIQDEIVSEEEPLRESVRAITNLGAALLVIDDLDSLCKRVPEIPPATRSIPLSIFQVPVAHTTIGSYTSRDTHWASEGIPQVASRGNHQYRSHEFRPVASPTAGPYKGLSLCKTFLSLDAQRVLCCGDGSGGFTFSVLRSSPDSIVYYNSLISSDSTIQQAPPVPYLPALAGHPDLERRLVHLSTTNDNITDLMDPRYPQMFVTKFSPKLDAIMCDAECKDYLLGKKPLELALSIVRLADATTAQTVVFKTYSLSLDIVRLQVSIFLTTFEVVDIVRCHFSNLESTEVYLIASRFVKPESLVVGENSVEGRIISEDRFRLLPAPSIPSCIDFIADYSRMIHEDWANSVKADIMKYAPFSRQKELVYPSFVTDWDQSKTRKPNFKVTKAPLTSLKNPPHHIVRLSTMLLLAWTGLDSRHTALLTEKWSSLYVFRYPLRSGAMFTTLCDQAPPTISGCSSWKLDELFRANDLKLFHRLRGIWGMLHLHVTCGSSHISGGITHLTPYPPRHNRVTQFLRKMNP